MVPPPPLSAFAASLETGTRARPIVIVETEGLRIRHPIPVCMWLGEEFRPEHRWMQELNFDDGSVQGVGRACKSCFEGICLALPRFKTASGEFDYAKAEQKALHLFRLPA